MTEPTITCPYCGGTIKLSHSRCHTCGKGWNEITATGRKLRPLIPIIGLIVVLIGAAWTALAESTASITVFAVGVLIFAYAVIIGHV